MKDNFSDSIFTMLQLQRALNDRENKEWFAEPPQFMRAAAMASLKAIDHYGWEAWASTSPNLPQVRHDMSNILCFLLANAMVRKGRRDEELYRIAKDIESIHASFDRKDGYFGMGFPEKMETLAAKALTREESATWPIFFSALSDVELEWNALCKTYFSENVIRLFRQDYAQDHDTYSDAWGDKDDRAHLEEIIADMKKLDLAAIRQALVMRYSVLTGRRATDQSDTQKQ
jgi:hypothetical protein